MKIGFIGLGTMGRPMAGHLQAGQHKLFLHDITPLPQELQTRVDKANAYKLVNLINVSLTADAVSDDPNSFRDFSREGILARRDAGRRIALAALRETFHSQLAA